MHRLPFRQIARLLIGAALMLSVTSCSDRDRTQVQLHARPSPKEGISRLDILAQVSGPQTGLRYKWFTVSGECDPQETDWPATVFKFASGTTRDRVSVEIWRDSVPVARSQIDVKLDEDRARLAAERLPNVEVEITTIPPYEPDGGPNTRAAIAGRVKGDLRSDLQIVIYARADAWYIQPTPYAFHPIGPDNTWSTWTHTGSSYAVLVVRSGFDPYLRLDMLPQVGGYIVARTVVDGMKP
jgi:hypothetical protein